MPRSLQRSLLFTALLLFLSAGTARGDLVQIKYFDSALDPQYGGPLWEGEIDTVTNKLRIFSWTEYPRHSLDFWVPANLPLIWDAVDVNGAEFQLSNFNFVQGGSFSFGSDNDPANDFAFLSPVTLQQMGWYEYDSENEVVDKSQVVQFNGPVEFFPGWGGVGFLNQNGERIVRVANTTEGDDYDYRSLPILPVTETTSSGATDVSSGASTNATITVTGIIETSEPVIVAVPEASALMSVGLAGTLCGLGAWLRKRSVTNR